MTDEKRLDESKPGPRLLVPVAGLILGLVSTAISRARQARKQEPPALPEP